MGAIHQALGVELCKPLRSRQILDTENRLKDFGEFAPFDLGKVDLAAKELGKACISDKRFPETLAFLPHKLTWIEYRQADGARGASILQEAEPGVLLFWYVAAPSVLDPDDHSFLVTQEIMLPLANREGWEVGNSYWHKDDPIKDFPAEERELAMATIGAMVQRIYGGLCLINMPRPDDRRVIRPHAGLQRALAKARGLVGKFPLLATTEIVLRPGQPLPEIKEYESHLTGQMPLHKVRAHLWRGRKVEEYWRGNPAIGIKKSRYVVKDAPPGSKAA